MTGDYVLSTLTQDRATSRKGPATIFSTEKFPSKEFCAVGEATG